MMPGDAVAAIGARTLAALTALGHAARFAVDLLVHAPAALRRFSLVVDQIHAIGNRSLVIIVASGMAVGFVLALQM
jgi:phospholipid/cholesterol/gamma-HCH transport system permease protein